LQDAGFNTAVASCPNCHDAYYDGAIAAGVYEKALAATVVDLKKRPLISRRAVSLLRGLASRLDVNSHAVLVPVPLSKSRKFERGYNQAEIIAAELSQFSPVPIINGCLVRNKQTPMHRVAMDRRAREITVEKAFTVRSPRLIEGKEAVLVDDVFTSGSTASACARMLKKNGASKVTVVTLARAILHH
jgi:ComF family protein